MVPRTGKLLPASDACYQSCGTHLFQLKCFIRKEDDKTHPWQSISGKQMRLESHFRT